MIRTAIGERAGRRFALPELKMLDAGGAFSGYASLFGETDLGRDSVERGAFLKSLARRGAEGVRMLYQHDPAEPIGVWRTIREDGRGLYVEGLLSDGVARAREVRELMRTKALDGLSIGFETVRARADPKSGVRRILEADLWEISIVTFPMLPGARVSAVKALGLAGRIRAATLRLATIAQ
jgi:HK97 family phage prohead protease